MNSTFTARWILPNMYYVTQSFFFMEIQKLFKKTHKNRGDLWKTMTFQMREQKHNGVISKASQVFGLAVMRTSITVGQWTGDLWHGSLWCSPLEKKWNTAKYFLYIMVLERKGCYLRRNYTTWVDTEILQWKL